MKEIAILGATASGKTKLAIEIANEINANILSLDSLSIYKEVDIVSAKPTLKDRKSIKHFGIDEIYVNQAFNVTTFFELYKKAKNISIQEGKHLIIVGGTSFYLKALLDGLSHKKTPSKTTKKEIRTIMQNLNHAYEQILKKDKTYANKISSNDRYRIEKWYEIYLETGIPTSEYFKQTKAIPIIKNIPIFEIDIQKEKLIQRIKQRTAMMIKQGLIDEIISLEKKYTREPKPLKAIGIKETFLYLDGYINLKELEELISIHTSQLAKRQNSFNKAKFPEREKLLAKNLKTKIRNLF